MSEPATPADQVLQRLSDQSARFQAFLADMKARNEAPGGLKFSWDPTVADSYNCFTFAGKAMEALFGVNPYETIGLIQPYTNADEAYQTLVNLGYRDVSGVLRTLFKQKSVFNVNQGDLVLIKAAFSGLADDMAPVSFQAQRAFRWVVAVADPPFFWVVSSKLGLSKGPLGNVINAAYDTTTMTLPTSAPANG